MAFKPMQTTLLVVLAVAVAIGAALVSPIAGAKQKVTIRFSPAASGVRIEVASSTRRPLLLLVDGRSVTTRTAKDIRVIVPFRLVAPTNSRVVVRDARSHAVLATQVLRTRFFLRPAAPRLLLTRSPLGPTTARKAHVAWRTNGYRTSCAIDGHAATPCQSPLRLSGLTLGSHRVEVRVFVHNASSSVTAAWTVKTHPAANGTLQRTPDNPSPAATATSPEPSNPTPQATATSTKPSPPSSPATATTNPAAPNPAPTNPTPQATATSTKPSPPLPPQTAAASTSVTLTPVQFDQRATTGATIENAHVTGSVTIRNPGVNLRNVDFDGVFTVEPSADDLNVHGGSATSFYLWGAKRVVIDGTVFDGKGVTDDAKLWGRDGKLPSLTLRNCVMRNFYNPDPSAHTQAVFIGSSESVVVEGCTFENNGNTAHLFVSSFGASIAVPQYVCIRNNVFKDTHGAYYSVNVHPDEIPATARVFVQPGQASLKPLSSRPVAVRECA
jgi:hypothetical protein